MSRPRLSAPSGRADVPPRPHGALSRWPKLGRTGSEAVRSGALTLARTTRSMIAPPTSTSGLRRANASTRRSAVPDAGIDDRVERVDQEVDQDEDRRRQDEDGLDDRKVPEVDGVDNELPHAGPGEDGLRDHRAAEQRPDLEPDDGEHGDGGVAQGVPKDHGALGQALRSPGADVVAAQDLQHAGPRQAG